MAHIWFNKLYLKYEKTCFTFALKYKETFSPTNMNNNKLKNDKCNMTQIKRKMFLFDQRGS